MESKEREDNLYFNENNFNLIDLLYSSPAHIYSWFLAHSVNIDLEDCKKLKLNIN